MVSENIFRKLRITLTRIFSIIPIALICVSASYWEDIGIISTILFIIGIFLVGIATIGRVWSSLYISGYKSKTLLTSGPYSMCRNPLYFFSFIGSLGIGLSTETITITVLLMIGFVIYYPYVMKREYKRLISLHGDKYREYCEKTPVFLPSLSLLKEPEEYMVKPIIFRKNLFDAIYFIWIVGFIELIKGLHDANILPIIFRMY